MFEKHRNKQHGSPQIKESTAIQESPTMGASTQSPASKVAVIGSGIEISGDVTASTDLLINGLVNGTVVQSSHNVEIGESGRVNARLRAKLVKVSGEVKGDISGIEKVLLSRTGRVRGNIVAPRVQLEDGAIFKGSIDMTPARTTSPEVPVDKTPAKRSAAISSPAKSPGMSTDKAPGTPPVKDSGRKEPSLTLKSG